MRTRASTSSSVVRGGRSTGDVVMPAGSSAAAAARGRSAESVDSRSRWGQLSAAASPTRSPSRRCRLSTLPPGLRGSGSARSATYCGTLKSARRSRQRGPAIASTSNGCPGAARSPRRPSRPSSSSGTPTTAASPTPGAPASAFSTSIAVDVLAAAVDHVLRAVDDVEEAVVVDPREVAGVQPAVDERLGGRLGLVPVAADDVRPAHQQLADAGLGRARRSRGRRPASRSRPSRRARPPPRAAGTRSARRSRSARSRCRPRVRERLLDAVHERAARSARRRRRSSARTLRSCSAKSGWRQRVVDRGHAT